MCPAPLVLTSALRHLASAPRTGLASFHAPRPRELSSFHRERRRASGIQAERGAAETRFGVNKRTCGHFLPPPVE
ncbi:hypothetical protein PBY51_003523 [Eleginops maclovinus]|uniref:Uncharacterized protein n=1 Tax=Eleginops maclovinus TaxID=56733 RepID=A0AAN7Y377_ELEMC|nr:hypothetical protein PBY51_003523 [Eleginops maclovinus]